MTGFYFTFVAVLLAGIGARDQALIAGLTKAQGPRVPLLVTGIVAACLTAAFAAWAGTAISPLLAPKARTFFAAMALCLAGIESLVIVPRRPPREPTHSLGAAFLTLLVLQAIDGARFMIFALTVATRSPAPVALAGMIGGTALLVAGWLAPHWAHTPWLRRTRRIVGTVLLLTGLFLALRTLDFL